MEEEQRSFTEALATAEKKYSDEKGGCKMTETIFLGYIFYDRILRVQCFFMSPDL